MSRRLIATSAPDSMLSRATLRHPTYCLTGYVSHGFSFSHLAMLASTCPFHELLEEATDTNQRQQTIPATTGLRLSLARAQRDTSAHAAAQIAAGNEHEAIPPRCRTPPPAADGLKKTQWEWGSHL